MKAYENTNLSAKERAELLLKELSLDEKMAQVNCYFFQPTAKSVEERCPYGIGVVSALEMRPFKTLEECAELQRDLQKRVMALSPHHIPAIFHMEGVCGLLVQDAVSLPGPIGRGAAFDPALEEELGRVVGKEASALCISHIFAPVLDVTRDARFGRMNESYGEDETLVSSLGTAYTRGLQDKAGKKVQIEGVAKHFIAFHKGAGGLHGAEVSISERELRDVYAKPFEAAIRLAELKGIMPCYNTVNGEFVSYSSHYLRDLLRGELGFEGLTVSDYCAVQNGVVTNHVAATPVEAGLRAIKGGMDVEQQFPYGYNDELKQMFASGELDIALLDEAVLRVLEAKFRMGLFEHPFASENYSEAFKDANAKALTLRCAEESLVLLKNNGILPLAKKYNKIAVVGYHAGTVRGMFGGYTHLSMTEGLIAMTGTMAGVDEGGGVRQEDCYPGCKVLREDGMFDEFESLARHIHPDCEPLYKGICAAFPESEVVYARGFDYAGDGESGFEEALEICKDADLVILALGGKNGTGSMNTMGENVNGINIGLPPAQEKFIRLAAQLKKPMVGVHFDGRPISSDAADECLDAILECWLPSEGGTRAIVSVLKGEISPSGKLPVTVARCAAQLPMYYSHFFGSAWHSNDYFGDFAYIDSPRTPCYPFGYGLSYTTFALSDFAVSKEELKAGDNFTVSVTVENTGTREGTEVVQLYFCDPVASIAQPNKQLMAFARVPLKAGEKRRVAFELSADVFAFTDVTMQKKVEKGEIVLMCGTSSEDLPLTASVFITEDGAPKERVCLAKEVIL